MTTVTKMTHKIIIFMKRKTFRPKAYAGRTEYIIYHPNPCLSLPTSVDKVGPKGVVSVSIDIGTVNFAIYSERRFPDGKIEPLLLEKVSFQNKDEKKEKSVTIAPLTFQRIISFLNERWEFLSPAKLILIEHQLTVNHRASCVMYAVMSYLMARVSSLDSEVVLALIDPKCKGKYLSVPLGVTGHGLKQWSVDAALYLCEWRGDKWSQGWLEHHRGRGKTSKADDLADTICQLEAFFVMTDGILTPGLKP
jgi:hypothetical protein